MRSQKKYKVIVLGIPKTGTSTLTAMLRMLGYKVTGPELHFKPGDNAYLNERFQLYDGFQDYPWCFEWQRFMTTENLKFIVLKRDTEAWWASFFESYGSHGRRYLSYPYIQIKKQLHNKEQFLTFFNNYYQSILTNRNAKPSQFLMLDIKTFEWDTFCEFLDEPIPRDFLGRIAKKPHVKKNHAITRKSVKYRVVACFRILLMPLFGENAWHAIIAFLRKNGLYN